MLPANMKCKMTACQAYIISLMIYLCISSLIKRKLSLSGSRTFLKIRGSMWHTTPLCGLPALAGFKEGRIEVERKAASKRDRYP